MSKSTVASTSCSIITPSWPAPANIIAFCTTRQGGNSAGAYQGFNLGAHVGDDVSIVKAHREHLTQMYKLPPIVWLNQVHKADVASLDEAQTNTSTYSEPITEPIADASFCSSGKYSCSVMTADCLPVLITDIYARKYAAVHCGWRSLAMGILEKTIGALDLPTKELLIWLGPSIGAQKFEVGLDVLKAFEHYKNFQQCFTPQVTDKGLLSMPKWLFDIPKMATLILNQTGIEGIYGGEYCTYSDDEKFYSYRRDGITGRMASVIARV